MSSYKYRIILLLYILLIISLSSIPGHSFPDLKLLSWDKLIHFIEYSGLGILGVLTFKPKTTRSMVKLIIVFICFAIFDESWQSMIPGRFPSIYDVAADSVGIIISTLLMTKYYK